MNDITPEWLEGNGFTRHPLLGFTRQLSEGAGAAALTINVGQRPFGVLCVSLRVDGIGIATRARSIEEVKTLIRLLDGAHIDHPDEV